MSAVRELLARAGLALAVLVQLVVLYSPSSPSAAPFPSSDKVVHVLVFLVPVALAVLVTRRPGLVAGVFVAHAVVSEVLQATLLPLRTGDPYDALADAAGVGLGVLLAAALRREARQHPGSG
ncbi:VanZ family protein [Oryzobacter telluris]|uniref:VanZ family protein n=1 Tax=Oryzobacter telluris TaxID=3149179 RepID=UPI00370D4E49